MNIHRSFCACGVCAHLDPRLCESVRNFTHVCMHNKKGFAGTMLVITNPPSVKAGYWPGFMVTFPDDFCPCTYKWQPESSGR